MDSLRKQGWLRAFMELDGMLGPYSIPSIGICVTLAFHRSQGCAVTLHLIFPFGLATLMQHAHADDKVAACFGIGLQA
jgi:hypothetical protein